VVICSWGQGLLTTRNPITIQLLMSAPVMHAGMDTGMATAIMMGGAMVLNITEARATAITANTAVTIAGITNRKC